MNAKLLNITFSEIVSISSFSLGAIGLQKGGTFSTSRVIFANHIGTGFTPGDYYLRSVPGDFAYVKTVSNAVTIVVQLTALVRKDFSSFESVVCLSYVF